MAASDGDDGLERGKEQTEAGLVEGGSREAEGEGGPRQECPTGVVREGWLWKQVESACCMRVPVLPFLRHL